MRIFGLGIVELLVILVVVVFIFGPVALPKFGEMAGRGVRKLRQRADEGLAEPECEEES